MEQKNRKVRPTLSVFLENPIFPDRYLRSVYRRPRGPPA